MTEQVKSVNNPLTVISIFAALAEVAGTVALAAVDKELQHVFLWFVMGFPTLLVGAFFLTLNFNPKVLYAPSDFRNEENFLNTLIGTRSLSTDLEAVAQQLEAAKSHIIKQALEQVSIAGVSERAKLEAVVRRELELIQTKVESTRQTAEAVASEAASTALPNSALQARIITYLRRKPEGVPSGSLGRDMNMSADALNRALVRLSERGLISVVKDSLGDNLVSLIVDEKL